MLILRLQFILLLGLLLMRAPLFAQLTVTPIILDQVATKAIHTYDVKIYNGDKDEAYVQMTPQVVLHPGSKKEKQETIKDPRRYGLLISPRKMIIPAKSSRLVRVVILPQPTKIDRVYRLQIEPHVAHNPTDEKIGHFKGGVKILLAYSALIIIRPPHVLDKIVGKRHGKQLVLRNTGNSNALLFNFKQCKPHGKCNTLNLRRRLYAKNVWKVKLPYALPVELQKYFNGKLTVLKTN